MGGGGGLAVEWGELVNHVDNIAVFTQLALGVTMLLSPNGTRSTEQGRLRHP
jgi:hypothetical protein